MVRGLSDLRELGVQKLEIFLGFFSLDHKEQDDVVGGDLGCTKLMMKGRFEHGYAIFGMVVATRHGDGDAAWFMMVDGIHVVSGCDIDGERRCGGLTFFAALTV